MPSILPAFAYDIFISYRHNDNRSGWVTEFVKALQEELAATIKEPISVYFDSNPHDGLLETHNVDKSLEGKLKCLIFIPILSQTYCDPKSFAWQHEFCAFNKMAIEGVPLSSEEGLGLSSTSREVRSFGRDIKLSNGNVASRILPIKIHDLDAEDKTTIENEIEGVLRAVEFIFKSPGVNRSLRASEDHPQDNLNKTFYRDQINKVANAIKEILITLKNPPPQKSTANSTPTTITPKSKNKFILIGSTVLLLLLVGYLLYPKLLASSEDSVLDKSIAVLPFVDMSANHDQEYFADGLSEELLNLLAQVKELKVIGRTSSFQFKGKNEDLREIGKKLNVGRVLEGSVRKSDQNLKITAQLIDTRDGSHLWSQTFSRKFDDVFKVQDEIALAVVDALKINMLDSLPIRRIPVNADAYNAFVQGKFFYESNFDTSATGKATHYFEEAIRLDSTFALPWTYVSMCYWRGTLNSDEPRFKKAKKAAERALELDPKLSIAIVNIAEVLDNEYNLIGASEKIELALKLDPSNPYVLRNAGRFYALLGRYEEAIKFCKQALQNDPIQRTALLYLTQAYFYSGNYAEARATQKKYEEVWSGGQPQLSILIHLESGETDNALEKAIQVNDKAFLAAVYFKQGLKEKAKEICSRLAASCGNECAYFIARAYGYGNEKENALTWLERSYANKEKSFVSFKVEPVFRKFQNEPRFKELLKKMKFPN